MLAVIIFAAIGSGKSDTKETGKLDSESEQETGLDAEPETELAAVNVSVEKMGTTNANMLNYGGDAMFEGEYEYFIAGDNALYICPYNEGSQTFYPDDDSWKACDFGAYITLSDTDVYFLTTIDDTNAVCRMDKDGSNVEQIHSVTDGRDFKYLQYVEFSDQRKYLYFLYENKSGENLYCLQRYNLETKEVETVIEGDIIWYNLYQDAVYYTEITTEDDWHLRLAKAGLDGEDPQELDQGKDFMSGFIEEDTLYLISMRDEALLVYDLDAQERV